MRKIILCGVLFAVMLAMTGIAAADKMNIIEDGTNEDVSEIKLGVGDTIMLDINISSLLAPINYDHGIFVRLVDPTNIDITGLDVEINEITMPFGIKPNGMWDTPANNPVIIWQQDMAPGGFERFDLKITKTAMIPDGSQLQIFDGVRFQGKLILLSSDNLNTPPPPVPEMSTIILMSVGLIGLGLVKLRGRN